MSTDIECTEETKPYEQETFFTSLCNDWEQSSLLPDTVPTRVVNLRFGKLFKSHTFPRLFENEPTSYLLVLTYLFVAC